MNLLLQAKLRHLKASIHARSFFFCHIVRLSEEVSGQTRALQTVQLIPTYPSHTNEVYI